MSRAIQIRVSESVTRTVHVEDGVQSTLELLPVIGRERQAELLANELELRGFVRDGSIMRRRDPGGIELTVDLETLVVNVRLGSETELAESLDREVSVDEDYLEREEVRARARVQSELEARVDQRTEALRRDVTQRLERKLGDVRKELDGAIGAATVAALKEKAASLGPIESVVDDGAGNVAIRVRL